MRRLHGRILDRRSAVTWNALANQPRLGRRYAARCQQDQFGRDQRFRGARWRRLRRLPDAKPVLPPTDSPTVAFEVIDYIKGIATIRTSVDGRIVLR